MGGSITQGDATVKQVGMKDIELSPTGKVRSREIAQAKSESIFLTT
jgi:hypothetical protein